MRRPQRASNTKPIIRCAIYTRKSVEEGLQQEFNSLDAQREAAEAYVRSQQHEGWTCLSTRYDDGGFTGGNMDRPALQRLLQDIEAGHVDCIIVYKVDRLSRSLLDFARIIGTFEEHGVTFVSVTQQFNTATSMGRLVLNVLLSFAQFEREIISERTRDKIAATRRKGKWAGGMPVLGYDIDPNGSKLVVNKDEAGRVRAIFDLYLEHQAMTPVVQELERRGWVGKRWTTQKGHERGGTPFSKTSLHKLLTNVTYIGKVRYKDETHNGEHPPILDPDIWRRVQSILQRNGRTGGSMVRNRFGYLLKGLVRCVPCDCAMTPTHTTRNGNKRYRYYVCSAAQKRGWSTCPSKSVPAAEMERFVVERIMCIGRDPELLSEVLAQTRSQQQSQVDELETERRGVERDLRRWNDDVRSVVEKISADDRDGPAVQRLAELQERIRVAEERLKAIRNELDVLDHAVVDRVKAAAALSAFEPVWESLAPRERTRIIQLLVERVDYNGETGKVLITFHRSGITTLADELASQQETSV